jgi:hypothetical protein
VNFRPELAEKIMAGEKTVTRRLVSDNPRSPWSTLDCRLRVGSTYAVCPGRGKNAIGRVRVSDVHKQRIGDVFGETLGGTGDDAEARREGFADAVAFKLAWLKINGGYDPDARVWRVEFEVDKTALRVVHGWNTQCGGCGYGGTSWADSPALEGKPIITPESASCPACGARFVGNDERHGLVVRYSAKGAAA